ncbi:hypothetical protein [Neisseria polysaccharea]|nr:hypothetical protein [Neisseria polysaccharea]
MESQQSKCRLKQPGLSDGIANRLPLSRTASCPYWAIIGFRLQ